MLIESMTGYQTALFYSLVILLLIHFFCTGKMYPGAVTFKQKWRDLRATPGSTQYDVMVKNIENSVCVFFFLVYPQRVIYNG